MTERWAQVLYNYAKSGKTDLELTKGDYIQLLKTDDSEWWLGQKDGEKGYFPHNYVEELDYNPWAYAQEQAYEQGYEEQYEQSQQAAAPAEEVVLYNWAAGDECEGWWEEDQEWYHVRINEILLDGSNNYNVTFVNYDNTATLTPYELRPFSDEYYEEAEYNATVGDAPDDAPAEFSSYKTGAEAQSEVVGYSDYYAEEDYAAPAPAPVQAAPAAVFKSQAMSDEERAAIEAAHREEEEKLKREAEEAARRAEELRELKKKKMAEFERLQAEKEAEMELAKQKIEAAMKQLEQEKELEKQRKVLEKEQKKRDEQRAKEAEKEEKARRKAMEKMEKEKRKEEERKEKERLKEEARRKKEEAEEAERVEKERLKEVARLEAEKKKAEEEMARIQKEKEDAAEKQRKRILAAAAAAGLPPPPLNETVIVGDLKGHPPKPPSVPPAADKSKEEAKDQSSGDKDAASKPTDAAAPVPPVPAAEAKTQEPAKTRVMTLKEKQYFLIATLEDSFIGEPELAAPDRRLISQGVLYKILVFKDAKYYFWLFNDMIAYATWDGTKKKFKLHRKMPIDAQFSAEDIPDEEKQTANRFILHTSDKTFTVYTSTAAEKMNWLRDINAQGREWREAHQVADTPIALNPTPQSTATPSSNTKDYASLAAKKTGAVAPNSAVDDKTSALGMMGVPLQAEKIKVLEKDVRLWTVADVSSWLELVEFGEYVPEFKTQKVDGDMLISLDEDDFRSELKITKALHLKRLMRKIQQLKEDQNTTPLGEAGGANVQRHQRGNSQPEGPAPPKPIVRPPGPPPSMAARKEPKFSDPFADLAGKTGGASAASRPPPKMHLPIVPPKSPPPSQFSPSSTPVVSPSSSTPSWQKPTPASGQSAPSNTASLSRKPRRAAPVAPGASPASGPAAAPATKVMVSPSSKPAPAPVSPDPVAPQRAPPPKPDDTRTRGPSRPPPPKPTSAAPSDVPVSPRNADAPAAAKPTVLPRAPPGARPPMKPPVQPSPARAVPPKPVIVGENDAAFVVKSGAVANAGAMFGARLRGVGPRRVSARGRGRGGLLIPKLPPRPAEEPGAPTPSPAPTSSPATSAPKNKFWPPKPPGASAAAPAAAAEPPKAASHNPNLRFCPDCGTKRATETSRFCVECGFTFG